MRRLTNTIDRTEEYVNFIENLTIFHATKGTTLHAEPILGKRRVDLLKLYKIVIGNGGFDNVTQNRAWKQIGNEFGFPSTCTNSAYILKGLYIRNLLGWEEENVNGRLWKPPEELKGPNAHKVTTLAGNTYRKHIPRTLSTSKHKSKKLKLNPIVNILEPFQDYTNINNLSPNISSPNDYQSPTQLKFNDDTTIDEELKQKILFALRFGDDKNTDWALNQLLDLTFENTKQFTLTSSPILLELLLDHTKPYLEQQQQQQNPHKNNSNSDHNDDSNEKLTLSKETMAADPLKKDALSSIMDLIEEDDESSTIKLERMKKVMYIIRNYSTKENDAMLISNHRLLKETLIKTLDKCLFNVVNMAMGRCCIDIIDNMAAHIPLNGPDDEWIPCLTKLLLVQDRYIMVSSIKILTKIGTCDLNQLFLPNNEEKVSCIAHHLLSSDEELIGVSMEYLYQQLSLSMECRSQFLSAYNGAYIGLLVNKLLYRTKYYVNKLVKEDIMEVTTPGLSLQPSSPSNSSINGSDSSSGGSNHGGNSGTQSSASSVYGGPSTVSTPTASTSEPTLVPTTIPDCVYSSIPDMTNYTTLEEPYRCLGWFKDKFEATEPNNILSLDDMYLLYYARFGTEKALKLEQFYSVLKIAFPGQPPKYILENGKIIPNKSKNGTSINGLSVHGLQIKMNILLDELSTNTTCQWNNCTSIFSDKNSLEQHILSSHFSCKEKNEEEKENQSIQCEWNQCTIVSTSKEEMMEHLQQQHYSHLVSAITIDNETNSIAAVDQEKDKDNNNNNNNKQSSSSSDDDQQIVELKGISLIAAQLLRCLSEEPTSAIYFAPIEIDLVNIATNNPSLSSFVYTILSNVRIHNVTSTPTI